MSYSLNWDLDSILPGGSHPDALSQRMRQLEDQTNEYYQRVTKQSPSSDNVEQLNAILQLQETTTSGFTQCNSYITVLLPASVNDSDTKILLGKLYAILPRLQSAETVLSKKFAEISDSDWDQILSQGPLETIAFRLNEIRRDGSQLLLEIEENIIDTLSLDGLDAWSGHYDTIVASISIPFEQDGQIVGLSAGRAFNKMVSDRDLEIREALPAAWEKAWKEKTPLFTDILNHLDDSRLSNYELHGITNFLQKPSEYDRLKEEILFVMWETIRKNKQPLVDYLTRKANLFGKEKMEWQDQDVPIILGDLKEKTFSFDEAATFTTENFNKSNPKMAKFAQSASEKSWIEAEDRPGKHPGGHRTELPGIKEPRTFMTYSNPVSEVATFAHELGHAFHSNTMWDLPSLNREYAMNVAETASTFVELIVADTTLKVAKTKEEEINLLDTRLQNTLAMFMNIHS